MGHAAVLPTRSSSSTAIALTKTILLALSAVVTIAPAALALATHALTSTLARAVPTLLQVPTVAVTSDPLALTCTPLAPTTTLASTLAPSAIHFDAPLNQSINQLPIHIDAPLKRLHRPTERASAPDLCS